MCIIYSFQYEIPSVASRPLSTAHASDSVAPSSSTSKSSTSIIRVHRLLNGTNHNESSDDSDSDSDNDSNSSSVGKVAHFELEKPPLSGDLTSSPTTGGAATGLSSKVRSTHQPTDQLLLPCAAEDCMGGVVNFHSIDCKIGNRHFRLMLAPEGGDRSGLLTGNSFCEIFPASSTTAASSESHHGKG